MRVLIVLLSMSLTSYLPANDVIVGRANFAIVKRAETTISLAPAPWVADPSQSGDFEPILSAAIAIMDRVTDLGVRDLSAPGADRIIVRDAVLALASLDDCSDADKTGKCWVRFTDVTTSGDCDDRTICETFGNMLCAATGSLYHRGPTRGFTGETCLTTCMTEDLDRPGIPLVDYRLRVKCP